ncbi:MAG: hypothetical protein ACLFUR_00690 [Candidatus Hadarchaeia archaeon]
MVNYSFLTEKSKEGALLDLKADIVRVLIKNNGTSWETDLVQDLKSFRELTDRSREIEKTEVKNALDELSESNLLRIEDRLRASRSGSKEDSLINLEDLEDARTTFSNDDKLREYDKAISEIYFEGN